MNQAEIQQSCDSTILETDCQEKIESKEEENREKKRTPFDLVQFAARQTRWISAKKELKLQIKNLLTICIVYVWFVVIVKKKKEEQIFSKVFIHPWLCRFVYTLRLPEWLYVDIIIITVVILKRLQGISKWNKPYLSKTYKFHSVCVSRVAETKWIELNGKKWVAHIQFQWHIHTFISVSKFHVRSLSFFLSCTFLFINKF